MADELIKLILETAGQQGVQSLGKDVEKLSLDLKDLVVQWQAGGLATDEFIKRSAATSGQLKQTQELLNGLTGKPGSGRNAGQGLLGASYAVQDFTSQLGTRGLVGALGAIQNNIPSILTSLGVGAGMTGVISIAAVALGALIPLMQKAFGGESQEQIEETKKRLEEFEAQAKRTAEAFKKLTQAPTDYEAESAANIKAIFESRPNAETAKKAMAQQLSLGEVEQGFSPEQKAASEKSKTEQAAIDRALNAVDPVFKKTMRELDPVRAALLERRKNALRKADETTQLGTRDRLAQEIIDKAQVAGPAGDQARRRLSQIALPDSLARQLAGSSPEALKATDDADRAFDEANEDWVLHRKPIRDRIRRHKRQGQEEAAHFHQQFDAQDANASADLDARMRHAVKNQEGFIRDEKQADKEKMAKEAADTKAMINQAQSMKGSPQHLEGMWRAQQMQGMRELGMNEESIRKQIEQMKTLNGQLKGVGFALGRTAQTHANGN